MRTYAMTGGATGIGAELKRQLLAEGHKVISVDIKEGDIIADLSTAEGRQTAIDGVRERAPDGLDGFILWDRETESLWWPLVDKAVSGSLKGVPLKKLEDKYWEDTNWKAIKEKYPNAEVLISNQDFERPKTWVKYSDVSDIVKKYAH